VVTKFQRGGSPAARGKWGKGSGAHGGHGGGRCRTREGLWRRVDGKPGRAAVLRGAATVFRWPEGRRAVGK
jgi:hypothetical protein